MRRMLSCLWAVVPIVAMSWTPLGSIAQDTFVPRAHHEWGRYNPGAWKRVRVVTETLDENGAVVSTGTTETTTSLIAVTDRTATLQIDVTVEIAGKRFDKQPRIIKQDFSGHVKGASATVQKLDAGSVTVDGRKIPTAVRQVTVGTGQAKWISKIHYSGRVAPYVLRRETVSTDPNDGAGNYRTTVEVIALDMPQRVLAEIKTASHLKTVHRSAKGTTITLEVRCEDVPGGVVTHGSKQLDAAGKLLSRSTLEMINYGIDENRTGRQRRFHRDRPRRTMYDSSPERVGNGTRWIPVAGSAGKGAAG